MRKLERGVKAEDLPLLQSLSHCLEPKGLCLCLSPLYFSFASFVPLSNYHSTLSLTTQPDLIVTLTLTPPQPHRRRALSHPFTCHRRPTSPNRCLSPPSLCDRKTLCHSSVHPQRYTYRRHRETISESERSSVLGVAWRLRWWRRIRR